MELIASSRLSKVMDRIARASALVADEHETGIRELKDAAREIAVLEGWVQNASEFRPFAAYSRTVKKAVSSIVRVFDTILYALEAPNITEAQNSQEDLQLFLDEAAEAIDESSALWDRFKRLNDSDNPCAAWLNEVIGSNPMSIVERGMKLLRSKELDSDSIDAQTFAVVWDTVFAMISDVDTFWQRVADYHRFLFTHKDRIINIVTSRSFGERLTATREDGLIAAHRVAMIGDAETSRQGVAELLEHGHQLVEQALKLHSGILVACVSRRTFEQTQAQDVSALVGVVADHHPQVITPIEIDIRNAAGHRDYRIAEDGRVELSPARASVQGRSPVTVSHEELCDAVIRIAEDCAIMETALLILCGDRLEQTFQSYSSFLVCTIAEGFLGWQDIVVQSTQDEVLVSGRCLRRVRFAELSMLACLPLEGRSRLNLRLWDIDSKEHVIVIPVDEFSEWSSIEESVHKTVAFLGLLRNTVVDGQPIVHEEYTSKCIAVRAMECLADRSMTFSELRIELASWRDAAKTWNHERLSKAIATAIGSRAGAPHSGEFMATLMEFASQDVEELGESIF